MTETIDCSPAEIGTSCMICDEFIPLHFYDSVPRICAECKKRIKHILYPPEVYIDGIKVMDEVEAILQHVGYDDAQLGREK